MNIVNTSYLFHTTAATAVDREFVDIVFPSSPFLPSVGPHGSSHECQWAFVGAAWAWASHGMPWSPHGPLHGHPYALHGLLPDPKLSELFVLRARKRLLEPILDLYFLRARNVYFC